MRICLLHAACFVIYSSYSSMILFSSEIFVVLLLWLRHLLVTLLTAIVFKWGSILDKYSIYLFEYQMVQLILPMYFHFTTVESWCCLYMAQGCETSSFQLISSFLKKKCAKISAFSFIFSLFLTFLPNFTLFFLVFLCVCDLSHLWRHQPLTLIIPKKQFLN